jgi:RNA polymerase sigma factor (TIGR02999 family)
MAVSHDVTRLLAEARDGDADALHRLIPVVYDELRALAHRQRQRHPGETLNTTALVHEAYEKLAGSDRDFADRQHFFRLAARCMRGLLIDRARAAHRHKRGGDLAPLPLDAERVAAPEAPDAILALDEALTRLASLDERQAEVVELRYFVGLTIPEAADVLGLSEATIKRDWTAARAWLHVALAA